MKIKDLMKKPVVIKQDLSLSDVAKIMTKYSINSLIIANDEEILGIVTHHDMIKHFGESKNVYEIMNKQVLTLKENDKLQSAIQLVREKNIGIFPVVNSKNKIIGILDSKDILKVWDDDDFMID